MTSTSTLSHVLEGTGAQYQAYFHNPEEETHFYATAPTDGSTVKVNSFFQQEWPLFSYSQHAPWIVPMQNTSNLVFSGEAVKSSDFLFGVSSILGFVGITIDPNSAAKDTLVDCHYMQGRGLFVEKERLFKMANSTLFKDDSHQRLSFIEFTGQFETLKRQLGFRDSVKELIDESKVDSTCISGWVGNFPFNYVRSQSFPVGTIGNFKLSFESHVRDIREYTVCTFKEGAKPMWVCPRLVATGKSLKNNSLTMQIVANYANVAEYEKNYTTNQYREIKFRAIKKIGETTIDSRTVRKVEVVNCDVSGMACQVFVTIAPVEESGVEYQQTLADDGSDFINSANLLLNGKPISDSLPADFLRTQMWVDSWGRIPKRAQYLLNNFCHVPQSPFFSGGLILTPFQNVDVALDLKAHADALKIRVDALVWQAWYTTKNIAYVLWP